MKGLWKTLSPFAPDQSGASAVLYELGGIIVICDAGGCAGNVCGFDEPRWFQRKSAIFSAGLRDMDAILGRDEKLIEKLKDTAAKIQANFAAVIGTPVPSVIGTDYQALKRMGEKRIGIPMLTIDTNGLDLYDIGAEKAYLALFETFARKDVSPVKGTIGVIGATPLDMPSEDAGALLTEALKGEGWDRVFCYGMGSGLDEVRLAGEAERNIVVAPCGLKAAKKLEALFGTPYEIRYPLIPSELKERYESFDGKKILIVHQMALADTLRSEILQKAKAGITAATWFSLPRECKKDGDILLKEEDQFTELVQKEKYDIIIGDGNLKRAIPGFSGEFIDLPHFAVSGRM